MHDNHNNHSALPPRPSPESEHQPPDLDTLLAQRQAVSAQAMDLQAGLDPVFTIIEQDAELRTAFLDTVYRSNPDNDPGAEAKWQAITDRLRPHMSGTEQETLVPVLAAYVYLRQRTVAIEQAALEPARKRLDDLQQLLVSSARWDAILGAYVQSPHDQEPVITLQKTLIALSESMQLPESKKLEFGRILDHIDTLTKYYDTARAKHHINEDGVRTYEQLGSHMHIVTELQDVGLRAIADAWFIHTGKALAYMHDDRRAAAKACIPSDEIAALSGLAAVTGADTIGAPYAISWAYRQTFQNLCDTFAHADEAYLARRTGEHYDGPTITNHELVKNVTAIADTAAWANSLRARFPAWFTHGLAVTTFTEEIDRSQKITQPDEKGTWVAGRYIAGEKREILSTQPAQFKQQLMAQTAAGETTKARVTESQLRAIFQENIEYTSDHEKTHHAHYYNLTTTWLRDWQTIIEAEKYDISAYVTTCREQLSSTEADAEDLCESVACYKNNPAWIFWNAPKRFQHINALLQEFVPDVTPVHAEINRRRQAGEQVTYEVLTSLMETHRVAKVT